jgi:uncharacterized LabA/DUF88 family protein
MRISVYVDGESHYERSLALWRRLHGDGAELSQADVTDLTGGTANYPDQKKPGIRVDARSKFFWDIGYPFLPPYPFAGDNIDRAAYCTAFAGDDNDYHQACVVITSQRFDPRIVHERRTLADQRKNTSLNYGLLEKAKWVDIDLTVRVLEGAYHDIFDVCYFFTSDMDFLPVIRVVQRLGKKVVLFGYADGMGKKSELEYVPDGFIDLSARMRNNYHYVETTGENKSVT